MAKPVARLIALTNLNNPTGALIQDDKLKDIVSIARDYDAWLICDEVYRGPDQHGSGMKTSIADLYKKAISTADMSEAYSSVAAGNSCP